jgi:4-hydroxybenzoyl-CoA thioesterase/acyl-CoA thioester hydrolase
VSELRLRRRVQFHETDAAGIVHFSNYFHYMEEAEHALWRAAGFSIHAMDARVGWPRVHASFDYHRPLRFEDEFDAWIRIVALAERTIRYECLLLREGERVATGHFTIACVSLEPGRPMRATAIPDEFRARLAVAERAADARTAFGRKRA